MDGKISDERFMTMSQNYEQEQTELKKQTVTLEAEVSSQEEQALNLDRFLLLVRKYVGMTALTPEALHELVDRIEIHAPDRSNGKRTQDIDIHLNFVGLIGKLDLTKMKSKNPIAN